MAAFEKKSKAPDGLSQGLIKNGQNLSFSTSLTAGDPEAAAVSADSMRSGVAQITSPADPAGKGKQKQPISNFKRSQSFEENRYG